MHEQEGSHLLVEQPVVGDQLEDIVRELTLVFRRVKGAVLDGKHVLILLNDADLLGQGTPADAAIANGLLGMARAVALEGVREGWRINVVSTRDGDTTDVVYCLVEAGVSGQLVRLGSDHLGRLWP